MSHGPSRVASTINEQLLAVAVLLKVSIWPIWHDSCPNKSINQTLFATFRSIHFGAACRPSDFPLRLSACQCTLLKFMTSHSNTNNNNNVVTMLTNLLCVCVCTEAKHLNLIEIINAAIQIAIDLAKVLSLQCNQSIFTAT